MDGRVTYILGISCWYHDSAACLLKDGIIVAAAQEERFTRVKHDASLPVNAIAWCLRHAGITAEDLSIVSYYDKPFLKFERLLETYLSGAPRGNRFLPQSNAGMAEAEPLDSRYSTEGDRLSRYVTVLRTSRESCSQCFFSVAV